MKAVLSSFNEGFHDSITVHLLFRKGNPKEPKYNKRSESNYKAAMDQPQLASDAFNIIVDLIKTVLLKIFSMNEILLL